MVKTLFYVWLVMTALMGSVFYTMHFGNPFYVSEREVSSLNSNLRYSTTGKREWLSLAGRFKSAEQVGHNKYEIVTTSYRKYTVLAPYINIEPGTALYKAETEVTHEPYSGICEVSNKKIGSCYHYAN